MAVSRGGAEHSGCNKALRKKRCELAAFESEIAIIVDRAAQLARLTAPSKAGVRYLPRDHNSAALNMFAQELAQSA